MRGTALKPDFFLGGMPSIVKDAEAEKKGATEEERMLYVLGNSAGWKILNEYIDNLIGDLDLMNGKVIEGGASFDVIGQNAVVVNIARTLLKKVQAKVLDAKETCERPDGTNK